MAIFAHAAGLSRGNTYQLPLLTRCRCKTWKPRRN